MKNNKKPCVVLTDIEPKYLLFPSKGEAIRHAQYLVKKHKCKCGVFEQKIVIKRRTQNMYKKLDRWTDKIFSEETSNLFGLVVLVLGVLMLLYHIAFYLLRSWGWL